MSRADFTFTQTRLSSFHALRLAQMICHWTTSMWIKSYTTYPKRVACAHSPSGASFLFAPGARPSGGPSRLCGVPSRPFCGLPTPGLRGETPPRLCVGSSRAQPFAAEGPPDRPRAPAPHRLSKRKETSLSPLSMLCSLWCCRWFSASVCVMFSSFKRRKITFAPGTLFISHRKSTKKTCLVHVQSGTPVGFQVIAG